MALDGIKSRLDELLQAHVGPAGTTVDGDKVLAAGFVVVDRNDVLYSGAAGHLLFEPDSAKYTVDSISWAASITKLITAVCLLQLVDKKLIGLDDDVGAHLPLVKEMQILTKSEEAGKPPGLRENDKPLTLRHLLTHTSGLAYSGLDPLLTQWTLATAGKLPAHSDLRDLESYTTPLVNAPGASWKYGTSYDWAGQLLEKITGQRLSAYMAEHILGPLGMTSTSFEPKDIPEAAGRRTAVGSRPPDDPERKLGLLEGFSRDPKEGEIDSGGAGLFGSPADYAKFLQAVLQEGRLLSREVTGEMFRPQLDAQPRQELQGMAVAMPLLMMPEFVDKMDTTPLDHGLAGVVNTQDVPGQRRRGSIAWGGMLNSRWWIDRETGIAGVLFTSIYPVGDPVLAKLYNELERAVYSQLSKKQEPLPRI